MSLDIYQPIIAPTAMNFVAHQTKTLLKSYGPIKSPKGHSLSSRVTPYSYSSSSDHYIQKQESSGAEDELTFDDDIAVDIPTSMMSTNHSTKPDTTMDHVNVIPQRRKRQSDSVSGSKKNKSHEQKTMRHEQLKCFPQNKDGKYIVTLPLQIVYDGGDTQEDVPATLLYVDIPKVHPNSKHFARKNTGMMIPDKKRNGIDVDPDTGKDIVLVNPICLIKIRKDDLPKDQLPRANVIQELYTSVKIAQRDLKNHKDSKGNLIIPRDKFKYRCIDPDNPSKKVSCSVERLLEATNVVFKNTYTLGTRNMLVRQIHLNQQHTARNRVYYLMADGYYRPYRGSDNETPQRDYQAVSLHNQIGYLPPGYDVEPALPVRK